VHQIKTLNDELKIGLANFNTRDCKLNIVMNAAISEPAMIDAIENGHEVMTIGEPGIDESEVLTMISRQVKIQEKIVVHYTLIGVDGID